MSQNDELLKLKQRLDEKVQNLSVQLEQAQKQRNSVITTLELLGHDTDIETEEAPFIFPPAQIKGLTHHEALERIAKANNGRLKLADARRVIVAAGMISTPKNAYSILSNTIGRVGKFRKIGPGEYELPDWDKKPLFMSASK
jgi:hypothetical protein